MKKIVVYTALTTGIALIALGLFLTRNESGFEREVSLMLPSSARNASYQIGEREVSLTEGVYTSDEFSVTATNVETKGDVDGDGDEDSVLLFRYEDSNGTTQDYLGVALFDTAGYMGLKAVALGVGPHLVEVRDGLIQVTEQGSEESVDVSMPRYFTLNSVVEVVEFIPDPRMRVVRGVYSPSHPHATFTDCSDGNTYMLSEESNSLVAIDTIFTERKGNNPAFPEKMYVVLEGTEYAQGEEGELKQVEFFLQSVIHVPVHSSEACVATTTETVTPQ